MNSTHNSKLKISLAFFVVFGTFNEIQPIGNVFKYIKENKGVFGVISTGVISAIVGASGLGYLIGKYNSSDELNKKLEELNKELKKQNDQLKDLAKEFLELQSKYTHLPEKNQNNQEQKERFFINYDSEKFEQERRLNMALQRTRDLEETYNEPHVEI